MVSGLTTSGFRLKEGLQDVGELRWVRPVLQVQEVDHRQHHLQASLPDNIRNLAHMLIPINLQPVSTHIHFNTRNEITFKPCPFVIEGILYLKVALAIQVDTHVSSLSLIRIKWNKKLADSITR